MKKCSAFIFALLLLWSCGTPDEAFHNPIRVDLDERHDVSIFDIFERVEIIPLETTDESIFRFVDKLIYHEGIFYILDFLGDKILAFDSTGKFLFKIDDRGQGPEQYLNISDFEIDRQANKLLVLDSHRRELIEYDLNGNFLRRISLPTIMGGTYQSLRYLGNGIIAFWTFDDGNRLKFYDRNSNSIFQEHFPREERSMFDHFHIEAFPYANRVMRGAVTDNRVFEIFPDGTYSVAYTWDFGRLNHHATIARRFPAGQRLSHEEMIAFMYRVRNSEIVNYLFIRAGGNQRYKYTVVVRRDRVVSILHKISEKKTFVFEETTEGALFAPIYWSDEFVIGRGPFADSFLNTIPNAILDERNLEIKRNIDEFDNPTLIKYWFRR